MSTIADYSVFTKAFLASTDVDFSQLYGTMTLPGETEGFRAFAVIPSNLEPPLTPREAMNLDLNSDWSKFVPGNMWDSVSCRDADGNLIGNIVRIQPGVREGSIRLVAKVAVPATSADGSNLADAPYNTFVLVRMDASTGIDLPIAVATISAGYRLHTHRAIGNDPLDDVENANYVSFTINHLNGYTSVDFNPDAYATYDDVENALSRGIDGLHIAFDNASGDLKLLDKDGNVLDQANLPIKADVIIADGEEGYKYVKTDVKQDIHAAKAWMPEGKTAWETVPEAPYVMSHAALVVGKGSSPASREFVYGNGEVRLPITKESVRFDHVVIGSTIYMVANKTETNCNLLKVKGDAEAPLKSISANISGTHVTPESPVTPDDQVKSYPITTDPVVVDVTKVKDKGDKETTYVLAEISPQEFQLRDLDGNHSSYSGSIEISGGSSTDVVLGIAVADQAGTKMYTFDEGAETPSKIHNTSGGEVRWLDRKNLTEVPNHTLKYGLEAFVWTVKGEGDVSSDTFFGKLNASLLALGFHEGDDIALGTNLSTLAPAEGESPLNGVDADKYIHGKDNKATRELEVNEQRANAKEELVAWNAQHPALTEDRNHGTIIDSSGLDVRDGSITLGCGSVGEAGVYGIQMNKISESLDFTISHTTGNVQFDDNGHATGLTSSTLLSIESGSYISGAPTCLILAEVTHNSSSNPEDSPTVFTPVRTTAGFSVAPSYSASDGLSLTIHDDRENISAVFVDPNNTPLQQAPAIIEVQAIYTHQDARRETVPAQQMHTYIGSWNYGEHPTCSFLCNKIEEWMTAVGLATTNANGVGLYVVIRVY